jgi:hypothetical protein
MTPLFYCLLHLRWTPEKIQPAPTPSRYEKATGALLARALLRCQFLLAKNQSYCYPGAGDQIAVKYVRW